MPSTEEVCNLSDSRTLLVTYLSFSLVKIAAFTVDQSLVRQTLRVAKKEQATGVPSSKRLCKLSDPQTRIVTYLSFFRVTIFAVSATGHLSSSLLPSSHWGWLFSGGAPHFLNMATLAGWVETRLHGESIRLGARWNRLEPAFEKSDPPGQ